MLKHWATRSTFKLLFSAMFIAGGATSAFALSPGAPGDPCKSPIKHPNFISVIESYFFPEAARVESSGRGSAYGNISSNKTQPAPRPSDDPVIPPSKPGPCPVF